MFSLPNNDNRKILTLAVVAGLWWQSATTCAWSAPAAIPAATAAPAQLEPPLLPGQVGATYEAAMNSARAAMKRRMYQIAADNYRAAIKYKPGDPTPHLGLGAALEGLSLNDEAMGEYFAGLECDGQSPELRYRLGLLLMRVDRFDEAAGQFMQVIKVQPNDLGTRGNLGICYMEKGQFDTAIEQYKYIVSTDPKNIDGHYNLGVALQYKRDYDAAIAQYKNVVELNPKHSLAVVQIGVCMLDKGDYKMSEQYLRAAMKSDPQNYLSYIGMGRLYELQKKDKEALTWYKKAIAVAPKAPECTKLVRNMMKKRANELGLTNLPGLTN